MKRLGALIRSSIASVGFFGFMLTILGLIESTEGFYTNNNLVLGAFLILSLGLTGGVSLFTYWRESILVTLFNLSLSLFIIDFTNWNRALPLPPSMKYHQNMTFELVVIAVGFISALVMSHIVFKLIVHPISNLGKQEKGSKQTATTVQVPFMHHISFLVACLGGFAVGAVVPAFQAFIPYQVISFGIIFLLSILIFKLWRPSQPMSTILGFMSGGIILHLVTLYLPVEHPLSSFIVTGFPFGYAAIVLAGSTGAFWLERQFGLRKLQS